MPRLIGFAMCLVVGLVLAFVVLASVSVLATHDKPIDVTVLVGSAALFAIACDAVRARRHPRVPRASLR
ncbi:MAG: hypothetical protein ABJE66_17010 [Deltaproteobacteria bacterium]